MSCFTRLAAALLLTAGLAAAEPIVHSEGGAFRPFYAEVLKDGRYYLFGTKAVFAQYRDGGYEVNPLLIKTFIGKGPKRETVVIQTDKETPAMTERLLKQFRARHGLQ